MRPRSLRGGSDGRSPAQARSYTSSVRRSSQLAIAVLAACGLAVAPAAGLPGQQPRRGGEVVLPAAEPPCLNYLVSGCHAGTQVNLVDDLPHWVLGRAFEMTQGFGRRPSLVSRVQFTRTPPFTLTYHIRPEARWSDGVPVTARDFVFTHRALRRHVSPEAQDFHLTHVSSVRAAGTKTVRVVLRSRLAFWQHLFGLVLPAHALRGRDLKEIWLDRIDDPRTGRPIGTGPFLVERWERGSRLVLRRNPRYWGAHPPYLDRIVLRFVRPSDGVVPPDRLLRGEVDVDGVIPPRLDEVRARPDVRVLSYPTAGLEHFVIRVGPGGHPALRSKLVRQALAHGLDRGEIVRRVFGRFDPAATPSHSVVYHNRSSRYRPNWARYGHDPAHARRLLERAGCRRAADGIYECGGQRLALRFFTTAGRPERAIILDLAQRQLREAGIELVPVFVPGVRLFNDVLPTGDFDVVLFTIRRGGDPTNLLPRQFGCGGPINLGGYCQRLVTRDLDQSERILDPVRRGRVLNRADRQLARDVPVVPLLWINEFVAVRSVLRNYVPGCCWRNAENWWLDD